FAKLEAELYENERCQALFELAVEQPTLDMPEVLWKAYIDFEYDQGDYDKTRELYGRLLALTDHVKVWISLARFELAVAADPDNRLAVARSVYERAYSRLKELGLTEERLVLLEAWREAESSEPQQGDVAAVDKKMPRRVRKRRKLDDGSLEEYFDYVFPDDEEQGARFKLLAKAHMWKQKVAAATESAAAATESASDDNGEDGYE
ncbi:NineTeen Complex (NTC) component, partial [Coemansia furcata]